MHVHLESRPYAYARKVVNIAKDLQIDGICFTDHNIECPPDYFAILKTNVDIPIFWATEYSSRQGHILVFTPDDYFAIPETILSMQEVILRAEEKEGIAIPVHPFSSLHKNVIGSGISQLKGLTIIETINGALSRESNLLAENMRAALRIKGIGGSDAHNEFLTGRAYTIFPKPILDQKDLINTLKTGSYSAAYYKNY